MKNFKFEKSNWRCYHFTFHTCVPLMTLIWYMVPEIWRATDRIFCHFVPFFLHFFSTSNLENKNFEQNEKTLEILSFCTCVQWMALKWSLVSKISSPMDIIFYHFQLFFPIYPPEKLKFWENEKNTWRLSFHTCATNDNHIMYGSWDIECNGHNILSFWNIFCPLTT